MLHAPSTDEEFKKTVIGYEELVRRFLSGGATWPSVQFTGTRENTQDPRAHVRLADTGGSSGLVYAISRQLAELLLSVKREKNEDEPRAGASLRPRADVPSFDYCGLVVHDAVI